CAGRNGRGDGKDRLTGYERRPHLSEQRVEVLRLHCDHDEPRSVGRLAVRKSRLDREAIAQLGGALLATARGNDLLRLPPFGRKQPGKQRLADLPAAEDGDAPTHPASLRSHARHFSSRCRSMLPSSRTAEASSVTVPSYG